MPASKNPVVRLRHIIDEAEAIQTATQELTLEVFRDTWIIRRAVEHGLLIISEASKALPPELKAAQAEVPWSRLESLGNVLRHDYKDIEPEVLWRIINDQLPTLVSTVRKMLADSGA